MGNKEFDLKAFLVADLVGRARLSEALQHHLHALMRCQLESLFVGALGEIADHHLRPELPWSEGEFAFADPTEGREGLRVAFDVVVSVGFADRRALLGALVDDAGSSADQ